MDWLASIENRAVPSYLEENAVRGLSAMIASAAVALSGMLAQTDRVAGAAANLANQRSLGALPGANGTVAAGQPAAYQPVTTQLTSGPGGTVSAAARPTVPGVLAQYDPTAPYANGQGMVGVPNINADQEVSTLMDARNAYRANLKAFKVADDLTREALNLTA
jgi:flagellar basal-body rod protein FlgC